MKSVVSKRALHAAMVLAFSAGAATAAQAAPIVQTAGPGGENTYATWTWDSLAQVALASGTNKVLALTSQVTLVDQGYGGTDPANGVFMSLDVNGSSIWSTLVAGSSHSWMTQNYDIASNPTMLTALNTALAAIDWSTTPVVDMSLRQRGYGYPGWALHTTNATFSVTSDAALAAVPEPASWAMMIVGMGSVGFAMRRRQVAKRVVYAA